MDSGAGIAPLSSSKPGNTIYMDRRKNNRRNSEGNKERTKVRKEESPALRQVFSRARAERKRAENFIGKEEKK